MRRGRMKECKFYLKVSLLALHFNLLAICQSRAERVVHSFDILELQLHFFCLARTYFVLFFPSLQGFFDCRRLRRHNSNDTMFLSCRLTSNNLRHKKLALQTGSEASSEWETSVYVVGKLSTANNNSSFDCYRGNKQLLSCKHGGGAWENYVVKLGLQKLIIGELNFYRTRS